MRAVPILNLPLWRHAEHILNDSYSLVKTFKCGKLFNPACDTSQKINESLTLPPIWVRPDYDGERESGLVHDTTFTSRIRTTHVLSTFIE